MAKKKKTSARRSKPTQDPVVIAIDEAKRISADFMEMAKTLRQKFDNADDTTKKKILAGAAGAIALVAAMRKVKKIRRKRKEKKRVM